jgi:hypothetical protein
LFLNELFVAQTPFYYLLKVALFAVLHDNVKLEVSLVNAAIVVANYVWVLQITQDVYLSNDLLLFFVIHLAVV